MNIFVMNKVGVSYVRKYYSFKLSLVSDTIEYRLGMHIYKISPIIIDALLRTPPIFLEQIKTFESHENEDQKEKYIFTRFSTKTELEY